MKFKKKKSEIPTIALIIGGLMTISCSQSTSENTIATETAATGTAENSTSIENNQSKNADIKKPIPKQSDENSLTGKYILSEIGISGEHLLELKNKNVAAFKVLEEDGTSTGTGTWNWDKTTELLTVTLTVKTEVAGDEDQPTISKAVFQLKKEDKNLKIVKDGWSPDNIYVGKIFKKVS